MRAGPFFSVIIPVHNAGATLHEAVGSILAQGFTDWELLLVENASTDRSGEVAHAFAQTFPNKIRAVQTDKKGVSYARNEGMRQARGQYLLFLDADDHYLAGAMAHMAAALQGLPTDMLVTTFPEDGANGSGRLLKVEPGALLLTLLDRPSYAAAAHRELADKNMALRGPWGKAYRRAFLEKHNLRFEERCDDQEDLLFNAQVLRNARTAAVLDRATYRYLPRPGSATRRTDAHFLRSTGTALGILLDGMRETKGQKVRDAVLYRAFRMILQMVETCQNGQEKEARDFMEEFLAGEKAGSVIREVRGERLFLDPGRDRYAGRVLQLLREGRRDEVMGMRTEKISVIVPVYNIRDYLPRCAESVIRQTYRNLEIILVDDGSTDGCAEICDQMAEKDARITVVHQRNQGLSAARNAGIQRATGDYIAFVDGDDYVEADYVNRLYRALVDNEADMSVCSIRKVQADGTEIPTRNLTVTGGTFTGREVLILLSFPACIPWVVAWNKLYKRALFSTLRYPVGKLHEDEFVMHALYLQCQRVSCVSSALYNYVQRPGSIMDTDMDIRRLDQVEALIQRVEAYTTLGKGFQAASMYALDMAEFALQSHQEKRESLTTEHQNRIDELQAQLQEAKTRFMENIGTTPATPRPDRQHRPTAPVSIIVPAYNVEELLEDCLHSLLAQEVQPKEILLINDGSTDRTGDICDDYADRYPHIRALHHPTNRGQAAARNLGVKEARGEFIVFVDSDDTIPPDHLSYLLELKQRFHADLAMGTHQHYSFWDGKETVMDAADAIRALFRFRRYSPVAMLIPVEIARHAPFPEGRVCEDLAALPQIIGAARRVAFSTKVIYNYRRRSGSTMTSSSAKLTRDLFLALADCYAYVRPNFPDALSQLILRIAEKILEEHAGLTLHAPDVLTEVMPLLRDTVRTHWHEFEKNSALSAEQKTLLREIGEIPSSDNPSPACHAGEKGKDAMPDHCT